VGSHKVAVSIGSKTEMGFDIIGIGSASSAGLRKGLVVDIEETVSAITSALEEAERMAGTTVTEAFVGINGTHIQCESSKGIIAVSRADGEISESDVLRVIEAAKAMPTVPNKEILHIIPKNFMVDGQGGIKDPVGMSGVRLEVETQVITASVNAVKNLSRCVNQAGVKINGLVYAPLACSKLLLSKRQKEIGVALIDIGSNTTSLTVFEEGDILYTVVLPIGASYITNDIAIGLRTTLDVAEAVKLKYGTANPEKVPERATIDLNRFDKNEDATAETRYIAEIVEARLNEIFMMVKDELRKIGREGLLPAGAVLTGGGTKTDAVIELAKETLRLPAQLGMPIVEISGMVDKVEDPIYSTAIGLLIWGSEQKLEKDSYKLGTEWLTKFIKSFKNFLP